jgi:hypothetical protein
MQRDDDLIRTILFATESATDHLNLDQVEFGEWTRDQWVYHIRLLKEQGYLHASIQYADNMPYFVVVSRLTGSGHDLLDAIRSDTVWAKVKSSVAQTAGTVGLEVIRTIATAITIQLMNPGGPS